MKRRCQEIIPLLGPLFDGVLDEGDRALVQEHLTSCDACADRRTLLAATAAALRERLLARSAQADFGKLADRVMARVAEEKRPPRALRVETWGSEMWGAHRGLMAGGASLALAACLALGVFFAPPPIDEFAQNAEAVADARQTSVDEIDFGNQNGAVLQLPHETTVIWLADDASAPAANPGQQ